MHCTELELILCEYVDGTLRPAERTACDQHFAQCAACRELLAEQRSVLEFLEGVPVVEPPAELITRLVQDSPIHKVAAERARRGWLRRTLAPLIDPILQPRFAMGMAMTILSFSMLGKFAAPVKQLKPSDLDPVKVWSAIEDKTHRTWDRGVKYYESMRLVWEVRSRLDDLQNAEAPAAETPANGPAAKPDSAGSGKTPARESTDREGTRQ